jgi:alpha-N-acetylglucosamine transferase
VYTNSNVNVKKQEIHNYNIKVIVKYNETFVADSYFKHAMLKLEGFSLFQYNRIIHLDADIWLHKSIDHLFDLPEVPLAAAVANWEADFCISGALFVIKPSVEEWSRINAKIGKYAMKGRSEMNLINELYEHRIIKPTHSLRILPRLLILPSKYMPLSTEFTYPEPYNTNVTKLITETIIFHFSGGYGKPWNSQNKKNMNNQTKRLYNTYMDNWVC